jgi:hypothetical protein
VKATALRPVNIIVQNYGGRDALQMESGKVADPARHADKSAPCWRGMNSHLPRIIRAGALLAINLLFLSIWGFASLSKLIDGIPPWFDDKFGKTFLAGVPGLPATFWMLTLSELLAFALAVLALFSGEFLERRSLKCLPAMLVWSLFVFVHLGFGQWLTNEFNGAFQQFMYFSGTLLALHFLLADRTRPAPGP